MEVDFVAGLVADLIRISLQRLPIAVSSRSREERAERRLKCVGLTHETKIGGMRTIHRVISVLAEQSVTWQVMHTADSRLKQSLVYVPQFFSVLVIALFA